MNYRNPCQSVRLKILFTAIVISFSNIAFKLFSQPDFERKYITELFALKDFSNTGYRAILQDSYGYLWLCTQTHLLKYNGYDHVQFINIPADSLSFNINMMTDIAEDKSGNLWIGGLSGEGLERYNREKETFEQIFLPVQEKTVQNTVSVTAIEVNASGIIWIGTQGNGFYKITPGNKTNKQTIQNLSGTIKTYTKISNLIINAIIEDKFKNLWLGTNDGLFRISLDKNSSPVNIVHFRHDKNNAGSISDNTIQSLAMEGDSVLWIGTFNGLNKTRISPVNYQKSDNSKKNNKELNQKNPDYFFRKYKIHNKTNEQLNNNIVELCFSRSGILWLTTEDKICCLKPGAQEIEEFELKKSTLKLINYKGLRKQLKSFREIMEDKNGTIWILAEGAEYLIKIYPNLKLFTSYIDESKSSGSIGNSLSNNTIEDSEGFLWFLTKQGLVSLNKAKNIYKYYIDDNLKKRIVTRQFDGVLMQDQNNSDIIWITNFYGYLIKFDKKKGYIKDYQIDPKNPKNEIGFNASLLSPGNNNYIWIGTWGSGLVKFYTENGTMKRYKNNPDDSTSLSDNNIMQIFFDSKGIMWVATFNGLNQRIDSTGNFRFKRYFKEAGNNKSLSNNFIMRIVEDHTGNLWIATLQGGINKFDRETEEFKHFPEIPYTETLATLIEDHTGNFWIGIANGLVRWNPITGKSRRFDLDDGLLNLDYTPIFYQSLSGEIYVAGYNGVNSFYPDEIKDNDFIPPVALTKFLLFNKDIKVSENSPLKKSLDLIEKIELNYNQNFISFEFAALNFLNSDKNQYKYQMLGLDKEWVDAGNRRFVSYSDLKPGNYTFKVIGSNNDGIWNNTGRSVEIIVYPPWWRTYFAYASYLLVIILTIYFYVTLRERKLKKDKIVLEKTVKERTAEINKQKEELQSANEQITNQKEVLESTLEHLKKTQAELIQSEKMASLGQLIAGIAHEINTPLGAINASITTITDSTHQSIKLLPDLVKSLSESELKMFMELVNRSAVNSNSLSSKEEREVRRKIATQLEEKGIAEAEEFADILVDMGVYDDIENYLTLFKPQTMQAAYHLSMQIKNSQNIKMAVDRASKVVFALKNYARCSNEESMVEANILDGLETVLTLYHNQLKHGITLHKEFEEVPQILCYPDELNQVWTNLIHNAIQAMEGKGELSIHVETYGRTSLRVSITDTGKGIPPEIKDRIFDAFFTTKTAGEGSGLGLYILKQIIDKHKGSITFESEMGKGTSFKVIFPL